VLYPNWGLAWEAECDDLQLMMAYARVYNNWIIDFCKNYPDRLIAIPHIPVQDVEEAVKELKRVVKLGAKGAQIGAEPLNNIPYGAPYYDPFWAEAQDLDIPIALHTIGRPNWLGSTLYPEVRPETSWYAFVLNGPGDIQLGLASLIGGGALDRFPRLKVILLESGIGWLPFSLEKMDSCKDLFAWSVSMKLPPSEYFQRQGWVSMDPDDRFAPLIIPLLGANRILWAADYPHLDAHLGTVELINKTLSTLSQADRRRILGGNAIELYNL